MTDGITLQYRPSLAVRIHKMIPEMTQLFAWSYVKSSPEYVLLPNTNGK